MDFMFKDTVEVVSKLLLTLLRKNLIGYKNLGEY